MLGSRTLKIVFIDSEVSMHEHFFTRWMMACSNIDIYAKKKKSYDSAGSKNSNELLYGMPRLDFAIKVYKWPTMSNLKSEGEDKLIEVQLNFIYYFSGVFPISIETINVKHGATDAGSFSRPVDFKFDNMYIISDHTMAEAYRFRKFMA